DHYAGRASLLAYQFQARGTCLRHELRRTPAQGVQQRTNTEDSPGISRAAQFQDERGRRPRETQITSRPGRRRGTTGEVRGGIRAGNLEMIGLAESADRVKQDGAPN